METRLSLNVHREPWNKGKIVGQKPRAPHNATLSKSTYRRVENRLVKVCSSLCEKWIGFSLISPYGASLSAGCF